MSRIRRCLRALRAFCLVTLSVAVIALALLVAGARALLPYSNHISDSIEELVSRSIGAEVSIDHVEGHWRAFGPEFYIDGLVIHADDGAKARFNRASLTLDLYGALLARRSLASVTVFGADVTLLRDQQGRVRLGGLDLAENQASADYSWLVDRARLELVGSRLQLRDAASGLALDLENVSLQLDRGRALGFSASLPQHYGGSVSLAYRGDLLRTRSGDSHSYLMFQDVPAGLLSELPGMDGEGQWHGRVDGQLWVDALDGRPADAVAKLAFRPPDQARSLETTLRWRPTLDGWDLLAHAAVAEDNGPPLGPGSWIQLRGRGDRILAGIDRLDLERFLPMMAIAGDRLPDDWRISSARFGGLLGGLRLGWQKSSSGEWQLDHANGAIESLTAVGIADGWPDIEGLAASVNYANRTLRLDIDSDATLFGFRRLFPEPLYLNNLSASTRLSVDRSGHWLAEVDHFRVHLGGADISLAGVIERDPVAIAFVDARISVSGGDVTRVGEVLPSGIMKPKLTAWLLESLQGGEIGNARGLLHGPLKAFPFEGNEGLFLISAQLRDMDLKYRPEWPPVQSAASELEFINNGLRVSANQGITQGLEISSLEAAIDDYEQPWLRLQASGTGRERAVEDFFHASPLPGLMGDVVEDMRLAADAEIDLDLLFPLKDTLGDFRVDGSVQVAEGVFSMPELPWPVEGIGATAQFDREGLSIQDARARVLDQAVAVSLAVAGGDQPTSIQLDAAGDMAIRPLIASLAPDAPAVDWFGGSAALELSLSATEGEGDPVLSVLSSLEGASVALPPPFERQPEDPPEVFELVWTMTPDAPDLDLAWGDRMRLRAAPTHVRALAQTEAPKPLDTEEQVPDELAEPMQSMEWAVFFGSEWPALTARPGLHVGGQIEHLDLDGWMSVIGPSAARTGESLLTGFRVTVETLEMLRREFQDVVVDLERTERHWEISLDSAALAGNLRLPAGGDSANVVVAQMQRIHWPQAADDEQQTFEFPDLGENATLPSLQILADEVRWGEALLGEFRLEAFPDLEGYRVERLETRLKDTDIIGSGRWFRSETPRSEFEFRLTANDLGQLLDGFGYANLVKGGQTRLQISAGWPGAPWDFSLAELDGQLGVEVGRGQIVDVEPGAGRVLGLFSLQALPRRLALDFSDFFGSGLTFEAITGEFEFDDGLASTDGLLISALSADIVIRGSTDLVNREYQQEIIVTPNMGNALPLVGALAGGPTGAAALWVLQEAFSEPMGDIAQASYRITGAWESPNVELIETIEREELETTEQTSVAAPPADEQTAEPDNPCTSAENEENECQ